VRLDVRWGKARCHRQLACLRDNHQDKVKRKQTGVWRLGLGGRGRTQLVIKVNEEKRPGQLQTKSLKTGIVKRLSMGTPGKGKVGGSRDN